MPERSAQEVAWRLIIAWGGSDIGSGSAWTLKFSKMMIEVSMEQCQCLEEGSRFRKSADRVGEAG